MATSSWVLYNTGMYYVRKIIVGISCGLLPLLLFALGLSYSLYQVIGKPDGIKSALSESGMYDSASNSFVDVLQKDTGTQPAAGVSASDELPVEKAKVKEAIAEAFPPTNLKMHVEGLIGNTYRWIQGETADLDLSLNVAENQASLLASLQHQAKERAASLPQCEKLPLEEMDIFSATCLPIGITPDMAAEKALAELGQGEFFKQPTIDISSAKDETGQTLETRLKDVPVFYDAWIKGMWAVGILSLLLLSAIIFLSEPWQSGVRRAAKISLTIGVSSVLFAWLSYFLVSTFAESLAKSSNSTASLQVSVIEVIRILAQDIRLWWLGCGVLLIILGIVALVTLKIIKRKEMGKGGGSTPLEKQPMIITD